MGGATYRSSGVDISKANRFVKSIQGHVGRTMNDAVLRNPGAFGSLFSLDKSQYDDPVLVSSTDGVGTKLLLAQKAGIHDTVGIDLVAMNVNDILAVGAKPLFFLDYIACGKVDVKVLNSVVKGIARGCEEAGCALIGGETAEMPGLYKKDEYDLAGFAVGVVERAKIIDGSRIEEGDKVVGLASSGPHSNGYSLVRKVLSPAEQKRHLKELLAPTRIYIRQVLPLLELFDVHGIAHITGGAYYEKLTKILPKGKCFAIERGSWPVPEIFQKMQKKGKISVQEMHRTFNMGIGLALVVRPGEVPGVRSLVEKLGVKAYVIGEVVNDKKRKIIL